MPNRRDIHQKVFNEYGQRPQDGDIGIEIECESQDWNKLKPLTIWRTEADPSLRNAGVEFITRGAILFRDIRLALNEWKEAVREVELINTYRTSVHTHINYQKRTFLDCYTTICLYWIVENLLVRYSGKHREGNLFCLRISDADFLCASLIRGLERNTLFSELINDQFKYAALNLVPINRLGTIEFRSMRGVYDVEVLEEWVTNLYHLTETARYFQSPLDVTKEFQKVGHLSFLQKTFSPKFVRQLTQDRDWQDLMDDGFHYSVELAYNVNEYLNSPVKAKPKIRKPRIKDEFEEIPPAIGDEFPEEEEGVPQQIDFNVIQPDPLAVGHAGVNWARIIGAGGQVVWKRNEIG